MVVQASKDLVVSVGDHDHSQGESQDDKGKWLQTIEVAQAFLPESKPYIIAAI